jgi:hypothetical protein
VNLVDDGSDHMSSLHAISLDTSNNTLQEEFVTNVLYMLVNSPLRDDDISVCNVLTVSEMFSNIHGGRNFHRGSLATYKVLNEQYPGHKIPLQVIQDMVSECPTCQKVRFGMNYTLPEENLHLKPEYYRQRIGIDTLQVTPVDKNGNICCIVIVKFVGIYPAKGHSAIEMARACFIHFTRYGRFDEVYSDPGSDLTSEIIRYLYLWLGQKHKFFYCS